MEQATEPGGSLDRVAEGVAEVQDDPAGTPTPFAFVGDHDVELGEGTSLDQLGHLATLGGRRIAPGDLVTVAALLTLVGYSVNDTVVVYDRVRENLKTPKKEPLEVVINRSINQTLSRTILTSGATMLVVICLFFLGGEVLNTFALTLVIGIIIGTYSSIYVAAAIVVIWKDFKSRRKLAVVPAPARVEPIPPAAPSSAKKKNRKA